MTPAQTKHHQKYRGEVHIDQERCKGCGFCIEFCPTKVLAFSREFNAKGYHPPVVVDIDKCMGCNLCGLYCPDFAIYAVRFENNKNKNS